MFSSTNAIILYTLKYPKGYIVHAYTQAYGRVTYVVNAALRGKSATMRRVFLQPMSLVTLVAERSSSTGLPRLREGRMNYVYQSLPYDFQKNAIAMFLAELLAHLLRDTQADEHLYAFLDRSLVQLDKLERGVANFYIAFLIRLSYFLGFPPNFEEAAPYFDMQEGRFVEQMPLHRHILKGSEVEAFLAIMRMDYHNMHCFRFSRAERNAVLDRMLEYFQLHTGAMPAIKSLEVLRTLFV